MSSAHAHTQTSARTSDNEQLAGSTLGPGLDLAVLHRIAIGMFLLGGVNNLVPLWLPGADISNRFDQVALSGVLFASAIVLSLVPTNSLVLRGAMLHGIIVISAICATSRPLGTVPYFYLWPVVIGAYFFPRRDVVAGLAVMAISFGVVLSLWGDTPSKVATYVGIVFSVALMAIVVTALRARQARLTRQLYTASTTDPLTGLLNRRAFEHVLARELERASVSALDLSLICFDIDHFKACNDSYGHAAGDQVLRDFAGVLTAHLRAGDIAARIGGEEFVVLLFDSSADEAERLAEAIGRGLRRRTSDGPLDEPVSFSAGVASLGDGYDEGSTLLLEADRAMYAAKNAGRCRIARMDEGRISVGLAEYQTRASDPGERW